MAVETATCVMSGAAQVACEVSVGTAKQIVYSGTLGVGDILVIDTDEMTVELNGVNVTRYFSGEFFTLFIGANEIEYMDNEAARTVEVRIAHQDRWL